MKQDTINRIIREKERRYLTGVPTASWWRLEKSGDAPKGFKIGVASKGYLLKDIESWIASKVEAA
ncbi:helix-turn-helix transcriptional regulator [Paremcibacter congregatus]|uniref:helix-turn-helix transcriptional regulator n=1 Tax=Paremcibacter congregatus TaxID=2043170 RepID=UPI0030EDD57F